MFKLLFEAIIGQKNEIRCSHWSKAGKTQTRTEGTGDPYLRYINYGALWKLSVFVIRTNFVQFIFLLKFVLSMSYLRTQSDESFSKTELYKNIFLKNC
jgi:hypothetical protein